VKTMNIILSTCGFSQKHSKGKIVSEVIAAGGKVIFKKV
jgi:hypothetical protein